MVLVSSNVSQTSFSRERWWYLGMFSNETNTFKIVIRPNVHLDILEDNVHDVHRVKAKTPAARSTECSGVPICFVYVITVEDSFQCFPVLRKALKTIP